MLLGGGYELFSVVYGGRGYVSCWFLGRSFRWKGIFKMITHKLAYLCAVILREYCDANFSCESERRCPNCIFSRGEIPKVAVHASLCYLDSFIDGCYGKEHQQDVAERVKRNLEQLDGESE